MTRHHLLPVALTHLRQDELLLLVVPHPICLSSSCLSCHRSPTRHYRLPVALTHLRQDGLLPPVVPRPICLSSFCPSCLRLPPRDQLPLSLLNRNQQADPHF